jgi:protein phosphatase
MATVELAGATDVGRSRQNNEDNFAILPELCVAIVADGMGGAACGEVASHMTVDTVRHFLMAPPLDMPVEDLLREAIGKANDLVWRSAQTGFECNGMGSTLVMALWQGDRIYVGNVGDSRAYLFRKGQLSQLSYDQNLANELRNSLGLSEEQISQYPSRNALTMAIGAAERVQARIYAGAMEDGDLILLCSDGLYNPVGDDGIRALLDAGGDLSALVTRLIQYANENGGPDNVTAVILRYSA